MDSCPACHFGAQGGRNSFGEAFLVGSDPSSTCLSCHRAPASAFSTIGRWDFQVTFLRDSPVLSSPEGLHAYYGEQIEERYNGWQRSLCNKCHLMD